MSIQDARVPYAVTKTAQNVRGGLRGRERMATRVPTGGSGKSEKDG
jgi:hypothetical protein